uniref:Lipoprotein n=1 Tax=Desulfovibrio sp. U5L TaxID=596152 RepID=I2Q5N7_9BACT
MKPFARPASVWPGAAFCLALLACLAACPPAAQAGEPPAMGRYANAKYGYAIDYPKAFSPQGEADAGDGQVFLAPGGAGEMRVYASYNVLETPFREKYQESLKALGGRPIYTLFREDWFVVSGIVGGKVYYEKTLARGDAFFTVSFTYDPAARALFESVIGRVIKSFAVR